MISEQHSRLLSEYNRIVKENDGLYRGVAKAVGLPDCAFWILYTLRDDGGVMTQSEISAGIHQPKQTVNSALKKLEAGGYIELSSGRDRRSKQIHLTEKGRALAQRTVDLVMEAEQRALSGLTEAERGAFLHLFRKYTDLLRENMQIFGHVETEGDER